MYFDNMGKVRLDNGVYASDAEAVDFIWGTDEMNPQESEQKDAK